MTAAALSEVSNGAEWNPDPSFSVAEAILRDPALLQCCERRPCRGASPRGEGEMNELEPDAQQQWLKTYSKRNFF